MKKHILNFIIGFTLFALAPLAYAQSATATLSGTVIDPQSASIRGATVKALNTATNLERKTTTNGEGFFLLPLLPPGNYTLNVEQAGFASIDKRDVILNVGEQRALLIQLKVAAVNTSVTVETDNLATQARSAEISGLVNERRIRELPLNGKDFNKLVVLAPGVVATPASSNGSPAIGGARTTANHYLIDGIAANDERVDGLPPGGGFNSLGNAIPNILPTESLQEFRIITSNADATFGRGSGGQIAVVTKSGTNQLHGSAYEYLRNDALDARDFFNTGPFLNRDGTVRTPPFRQNLFGGAVGGAIKPERHFFFGNYEGFRQRRESTTSLTLPNADLISLMPGDLGRLHRTFYIESGIIPATGNALGTFAPLTAANRSAAVAAGFPAALFDGNAANGEAGTVLISSTLQSDYTQDAFVVRTDHILTNRLTANFRYAFAQNEALGGVLSDRIVEPKRWQSPVAQFIYAFASPQVLELRLGLQRSANRTTGVDAKDERLLAIGVSSEKGLFVSSSGTGLRFIRVRSEAFSLNNQTIPQMTALHTLTRGRVAWRSGAEVRRIISNVSTAGSAIPVYSFTGFVGPNGLLGAAPGQPQAITSSASAVVYGVNGGPATSLRGLRATQQEYFTQADWQVRRDLTLNLGLRYAHFGVYSEVNGALSNLYAVDGGGNIVPNVSPFALGRTANRVAAVAAGRPLYQADRDNFEPRLGIAWNVRGSGSTVVRADYGLYHDRLALLEFSPLIDNPPFSVSTVISPPAGSPLDGLPFRLGSALPVSSPNAPLTIYALDPQVRNPMTHRFNVAIERQLGGDTTVSAAYAGARGCNLLRYNNPNGGASVPDSLRPDPRYATVRFVNNESSSDYDSLQIFSRRRLAQGLDFTVAYTFSRSLDDVSAAYDFSGDGPTLLNLGANPNTNGVQGGGAQFVPRPLKADRGLSNFDVRHNLVISHLFELPVGKGRLLLSNANRFADALLGGWSLAGIAVVRSGQPFNVTLGRDANDDGVTDDRPMLLSGSLNALYGGGGGERTQYLIPQTQAAALLGVANPITDPFVSIARNVLRAPAVKFYDVSLLKRIALRERVMLNLELNAFNVFNRAQFAAPVASLSDARFGRVTSTVGNTNPRQLQLGVKLMF